MVLWVECEPSKAETPGEEVEMIFCNNCLHLSSRQQQQQTCIAGLCELFQFVCPLLVGFGTKSLSESRRAAHRLT